MNGPAHSVFGAAPVAAPFDAVAESYDASFTHSLIGQAQRRAVTREIDRAFLPGQRILEINCGTGVDAAHLASRGVHVTACDSSQRMIEVARRRVEGRAFEGRVEFHVLPSEDIRTLNGGSAAAPAAFDGLLSNFAGLNCVEDLESLARDLSRLLRPGATALVCFFGRRCAWEIFWYCAHGNFSKAFRRSRPDGETAQLGEGAAIRVRYPSVQTLARAWAPYFRLRKWRGIGITVPPSYLESLARRSPKALHALAAVDERLAGLAGFRALADHVLLTFERTEWRVMD